MALHVPLPEAKYLLRAVSRGLAWTGLAWILQSGNAMQGTVHPELHAATPLRPTGSHLPFCALTRKADADGCVSIVAVLDLATLAGAVVAIAPTSFVAILALDVEARPGHSVSESMTNWANRTRISATRLCIGQS